MERGLAKIAMSLFVIILLQLKLANGAPTNAHMPFTKDNTSTGISLESMYRITTPHIKITKIQSHAFRFIIEPIKAPSVKLKDYTVMNKPVNRCSRGHRVFEYLFPLRKGQIA